MKRLKKNCLILSVLALFLWGGGVEAALIYSNDFDSPAFVALGVTATGPSGGFLGAVTGGPYAGSNGKSWAGSYFNGSGASSTLTLTGLSSHTGVSIDMILGFLNSWDSRDGSCCAPDDLDVYIDGSPVLNMTTNNALGTIIDFDGGTLLMDNGQVDGHAFFSDDLVDMSTAPLLTFAHTSSTLTLTITPSGAGWQGWPDEGWGMDAVRISLSGDAAPVPEPSTVLLLGSGLSGLVVWRRKRAA